MIHSKLCDAKDGELQFVAGANDAQLSTCELVNDPRPEGSVNVELPPESSIDQPPQRKKRKRALNTLLAMITIENKRLENELTSLKKKCDDLLKIIKRKKEILDHAEDLINRETNMVDMLWNELDS